ncbi:MAG: hypothetical protein COS76_02960 [Candidatus Portnoybacteria bacterium CG06_land_8_20_14_3_00_39_12]|uniref:SinR family protein n=1 Tax=Candidatus Portnoybacteria bacterium CG06_land_8_20_14_3_00_39_12 TaxID=1974809 RepID=A0A2M7AWM1_9BACT|nr:MAG: hypothetical protein COW90_01850 [Nitrospirae bacterium CG22_combo_CG10-13_8_21_14_all_44_11]PIU75035.1 MAG: hypothetical protein COS76_02960 [Candidatus Portnoybacteria bacterium CG06_land_8_20_14_3_00_39_12]
MKTYLISYDLTMPESRPEYVRLINAIKSYNYWAKPLKSLWLIKTDIPALQVTNYLRTFTDANDHILVIEVTNDWASYNLPEAVVNWMKGGL